MGRLPDKQAALRARGKEMPGRLRKVVEEVFIRLLFEVLAADFHGNDLGVAQFRGKAGVADAVDGTSLCELVVYQTIDSDDKSIAIHRCSSWVAGFGVSNFTGWNADGTSFKVAH
jgi:hypothetical protein